MGSDHGHSDDKTMVTAQSLRTMVVEYDIEGTEEMTDKEKAPAGNNCEPETSTEVENPPSDKDGDSSNCTTSDSDCKEDTAVNNCGQSVKAKRYEVNSLLVVKLHLPIILLHFYHRSLPLPTKTSISIESVYVFP